MDWSNKVGSSLGYVQARLRSVAWMIARLVRDSGSLRHSGRFAFTRRVVWVLKLFWRHKLRLTANFEFSNFTRAFYSFSCRYVYTCN